MKKQTNLTLMFALFVCALSVFAQNSLAQKTVAAKVPEPQKEASQKQVKKSVLQNYIAYSSLSRDEQGDLFMVLTPEERAGIIRFHMAFQLMKRPNLSGEQRDMIIESIANITADAYDPTKDRTLSQAIFLDLGARFGAVFSKQETFEIIVRLGGDKEDIAKLQKYQKVTVPEYAVQRKDLFRSLSAQDKSDVMRIHMLVKLAEKSLTMDQLKIIGDSMIVCVPEIYAKTGENNKAVSSPAVEAMSERIKKAFEKREAVEIFATLGGECGGPAPEAGYCRCLTTQDWCAWWGAHGSNCIVNSPSNPCEPGPSDCGDYMNKSCNGTCVVSSSDKK